MGFGWKLAAVVLMTYVLWPGLVSSSKQNPAAAVRPRKKLESANPLASAINFDQETYENAESRVLRDFKTNCLPPRPQYFSSRSRRGVKRHRDGPSHTPGSFAQDEAGLAVLNSNRPPNGGRPARINMSDVGAGGDKEFKISASEEEQKKVEEYLNPESEASDMENSATGRPPYNYLEVEELEDFLSQSPWETREEDELRPRTEEDQEAGGCQSVEGQPHAYWRGEGDYETIRAEQGKLMQRYMDTTVDPCQDFYQYACGNWGRYNPIPRDKAAFDTFEMLRESLDNILKDLLEQPIRAHDSAAYVKAKNLYRSCINYDILKRRGIQPLLDLLEKLGGWPLLDSNWDDGQFDWIWLMAQLRLYNNDILISEWVGPDIRDSDEYIIQLDQTILGLPTRDYYLLPVNEQYLEAYKTYMIRVAILLGATRKRAEQQVHQILDFEIALAKIMSAPDERRNVSELYQRMTVGELSATVPQVDWQRYLTIVLRRKCRLSEEVVIFALRYVEDLVSLLARTEPRTVANYLLWRFVRHRVNNLDDRFQEAKQRFYFVLFGREESPPRWKNCITQVNTNMGMAVGAMFVTKYFDEYSKNDTLIMTKGIQQAFQEIVRTTTWIDDDTKFLASEKISAMNLRIGYPDFILIKNQLDDRYKDVVINEEKYFENTLNILEHLTRIEQGHLGCPVNKTVWNTAPAVVNAYYSRNKNQIMFPAGILQPPFYHRYFPKSLNYGGIGVVIGHEITHGFDDKGRLFDKFGNLHRWWKDQAIDNFHRKAQCIIEQYSKYVVQEVGMQIDGINTQGENIADNGGIKQAFRAYKKWLSCHGYRGESLPGLNLTGGKLFFLNFAQVWCGDTRPAASRNKLKTAVHSPGRFRVIGTLSNSVDFSEVFKCPIGSPMNPEKKCSVW